MSTEKAFSFLNLLALVQELKEKLSRMTLLWLEEKARADRAEKERDEMRFELVQERIEKGFG